MSQHQGLRVSEIAEIIGAITVVIGLIFVGYELNQNTKIQRVTATQTLVSEYERALDVRQIREISLLPGVQQWWSVRSDWFSDDLQKYVDRHIAEGDAAAPVDYTGTECSTIG